MALPIGQNPYNYLTQRGNPDINYGLESVLVHQWWQTHQTIARGANRRTCEKGSEVYESPELLMQSFCKLKTLKTKKGQVLILKQTKCLQFLLVFLYFASFTCKSLRHLGIVYSMKWETKFNWEIINQLLQQQHPFLHLCVTPFNIKSLGIKTLVIF